MAARLRFTEKRCSKLFLSKVHHSLVEMATHELPAEILVKEVTPLLRIKSLDIFQFYLVHELFCVAVLRNRGVYPTATRTSASRPLATTAEAGEV
jgi:hypothetical protein